MKRDRRAAKCAIYPAGDGEAEGCEDLWPDSERPSGILLALAPVAFELMPGILELAGFMRIELCFGTADFADKEMEVGRLFFVPDKSGEREFLDGHRIPPRGKHSKTAS